MTAGEISQHYDVTYSAIVDRPRLTWPGGARLAVWIAPNIEMYEFQPSKNPYLDAWPRMPHPDVMGYSYRQYGNRVGFWRMLESFDRFDMPATASLNTAILDHFPEMCAAMVDRGWEFMSHGIYNTHYLFGMDEDQERDFYRRTIDTIRNRTGQQLKGMLGPAFSSTSRTPDLMAEAGLIYSTDRFIDDQPYPIHVKSGTLVGVPYTNITNDGMVFKYAALEGEAFVQMCKDQFDVLYAEGEHSGRVLCIALHPYIIGQPHRAAYLDEIFQYIRSHDDVWVTTAAEIAEWYIENGGSHPNGDSRDSEVGVPTRSGGSRD